MLQRCYREGKSRSDRPRSSIGRKDDEITDLGRVSAELLKAFELEPGDFRSVAEPTISQLKQQPLSAA
jgi:hypothetical protein